MYVGINKLAIVKFTNNKKRSVEHLEKMETNMTVQVT